MVVVQRLLVIARRLQMARISKLFVKDKYQENRTVKRCSINTGMDITGGENAGSMTHFATWPKDKP